MRKFSSCTAASSAPVEAMAGSPITRPAKPPTTMPATLLAKPLIRRTVKPLARTGTLYTGGGILR
jgi:hypothetical protein